MSRIEVRRTKIPIRIEVSSLSKGQLFEREGALCMVVENIEPLLGPLICNLKTGSVWRTHPGDEVLPVTDVVLSYSVTKGL